MAFCGPPPDWDEKFRGTGGVLLGVWIPRDPNYLEKRNQKPVPPEPPKAPAEDWIKVQVVDDQTGKVVPGVQLDIKVPNGFVEPHETRRSGMVESLGLESGDCEISGSLDGLVLKNVLQFVGVGDKPIESPKKGEKPEGIPDPEPYNRYRIVNVEKHVVQKGDSFRKLANQAGINRNALDKFNWPREGIYTPNDDLYTSDIVYIPKKWSQKGFETNRVHTIRVKREFYIEDDVTKKAGGNTVVFNYSHDPALSYDNDVRFKYEEGALKCSHVVVFDKRICDPSEDKRAAVKEHASFIYMDVGCWVDNADGHQTKCRNFGLVCGPHVYLCSFTREKKAPHSRVPSVQKFFREMLSKDCGTEVIKYAYTGDETRRPEEDSELYLFLGDLHLPPLSWGIPYTPMEKFLSDPDIFKEAYIDLDTFLNGIRKLSADTKKLTHFIHTGDMFEMWLGRPYLFKNGYNMPEWIDNEAPAKAVEWGKDVIDRHQSTFEALQEIWEGDFAEVKFLWGNHDDYLKESYVTVNLRQPERYAYYSGQKGNIFCEHGHRFDQKNFDNQPADGSNILNTQNIINYIAYGLPGTRKLEVATRLVTGIGHLEEREAYIIGASRSNLNLRLDQKKKPFNAYVMGHTHRSLLNRCIIEPKFQNQ